MELTIVAPTLDTVELSHQSDLKFKQVKLNLYWKMEKGLKKVPINFHKPSIKYRRAFYKVELNRE